MGNIFNENKKTETMQVMSANLKDENIEEKLEKVISKIKNLSCIIRQLVFMKKNMLQKLNF